MRDIFPQRFKNIFLADDGLAVMGVQPPLFSFLPSAFIHPPVVPFATS
jgi:hypothetical protein